MFALRRIDSCRGANAEIGIKKVGKLEVGYKTTERAGGGYAKEV
jgi:hypothetical protein